MEFTKEELITLHYALLNTKAIIEVQAARISAGINPDDERYLEEQISYIESLRKKVETTLKQDVEDNQHLVKCSNCKKIVSATDSYCGHCGKRIFLTDSLITSTNS